jgi:drug/metabolite transporter (DMT)-like permease
VKVRLALGVTVLMWAAAFVAIRVGAGSYAPGPFLFLRFLIPAVLLTLLAARSRRLVPPPQDGVRVAVLGALFVAYIGLLIAGERTIDAGTASMLAETSPLMTAALAAAFLGERASGWLVAGLAVGFAGAALIAVGGSDGLHLSRGAVLVLVAALAQAGLLVVQKPLLGRQPAITLMAQASVVGLVLTLPFAGQFFSQVQEAPARATLAIVFVAVTTGAVSYVTLAYAISRTPSTGQVSAVLYLVPPLAVLLSWAYLGEAPTALALVGGLLALAGVGISQRR